MMEVWRGGSEGTESLGTVLRAQYSAVDIGCGAGHLLASVCPSIKWTDDSDALKALSASGVQ